MDDIIDFTRRHMVRGPDSSNRLALRDVDNDPKNGIQPTADAIRDFVDLKLVNKRKLLGRMDNASNVGMKRTLLRLRGPAQEAKARRIIENRSVEEQLLFYRDLKGYIYLMEKHIVGFGGGSKWTDSALEGAISAMMVALDNRNSGIVFQTELQVLSRDPQVKAFIRALNASLVAAAAPLKGEAKSVDLWAVALKYANSDKAKASKWLAVLFQDLSSNIHTGLITDRQFARQLSTSIELMRAVPAARLRLYPPELAGVQDNSRIYHYYVPRYLAAKMLTKGIDADLAHLATLMMTVEYEYASMIATDMNAQGQSSRLRHFWRVRSGLKAPLDKLRGKKKRHLDDISDIYLGYRGSLAGSGLKLKPQPIDKLREAIKSDPQGAIRNIFRRTALPRHEALTLKQWALFLGGILVPLGAGAK